MFIPELPVGLLRQNLLYTIYPQNSRFFDEKGVFHAYFVRDFLYPFLLLLTCVCDYEKVLVLSYIAFDICMLDSKS